ncbi:MAG: DUF2851 family protein [Leadbetterella sp.]
MTIKEEFLAYVWRYQRFASLPLLTTSGQALYILKVGNPNTHAGADFEEASIALDNLTWVGSVEIHTKSSHWDLHKHQSDEAYNQVILHVVWENDKPIVRKDGTPIPTLEVKSCIENGFVKRFDEIIKSPQTIKCASQFLPVNAIVKRSMIERAFFQRLDRKAAQFTSFLDAKEMDFEELAYKVLAQSMGFKINSEAMAVLAESLPFSILRKHRGDVFRIEALLFGMAGFLEEPKDEYAQDLQKEFLYLTSKYKLSPRILSLSQWKFLRTRSSNFPSVRIAQLAAVLTNVSSIFDAFVLDFDSKNLRNIFQNSASEYWTTHYDFGKKSDKNYSKIGKDSVDILLINTGAILLYIYGQKTDNSVYHDRAIELVESIKSESNHITQAWKDLGLKIESALDSQALIEQYNENCENNQCLKCPVGFDLLKRN